MRPALPREEVIKAIEHKGPSRVPMLIAQWWNPASMFGDRAEQILEIQRQYPQDAYFIRVRRPIIWDELDNPNHIPGYSWMPTPPPQQKNKVAGLDANVALTDWAILEEMLAHWPDPNIPQLFDDTPAEAQAPINGRYHGIYWAYCLFERLWTLRGMENTLCDFYEHPECVHRILDAFTDFHCTAIRRGGKELNADAIWTTDDIGMQTGPMFNVKIFREFFKPRYARMIKTAHDHGMHFWLHTCGNIEPFLGDLIEIGLDVIHPIQKFAMDQQEIARRYGGRIAFWAGMDMQHILPFGTPEEVRAEVRFMIDTYDRADGGCMITSGNNITPDAPIENVFAFYDETYNYGLAHRQQFK
jgi:uroporphyrinogen decarboxylase